MGTETEFILSIVVELVLHSNNITWDIQGSKSIFSEDYNITQVAQKATIKKLFKIVITISNLCSEQVITVMISKKILTERVIHIQKKFRGPRNP